MTPRERSEQLHERCMQQISFPGHDKAVAVLMREAIEVAVAEERERCRKLGEACVDDYEADIRAAVAAEREACAVLVEHLGGGCGYSGGECSCQKCIAADPDNLAGAIRARGANATGLR